MLTLVLLYLVVLYRHFFTKTELLSGWNTKKLALIPYEKLNLARSNMTHFRWDLKQLWNFLVVYSSSREECCATSDAFCFDRVLQVFGPSGHSTPRPPFLRQAAVVAVHCSSGVTPPGTHTGPPVVQLPQLYSKFILVLNYGVDFKILPIILFFLWQPWRGFFLQKLYFDINLQNVMETRGILDTSMKYWWRC